MLREIVRTGVAAVLLMSVMLLPVLTSPIRAEDGGASNPSSVTQSQAHRPGVLQQTPAPVEPSLPLLVAEGSNSCEIVSCGMGIKQTCQITCPADKTPKCSCDCERSFGPMCMDYKANCRCE
ncbi:MAG: hypothetical protein LZF60_80319 [Nitrospira sp.]|nr:hypothetical protein [Nitrospira sp.]ULA58925.1 MAG: hypothetical protein LZF60_80319 [Nitrospira sp.]